MRLYRQKILADVSEDKLPLTNRNGDVQEYDEPIVDYLNNAILNRIPDGKIFYWSLPQRFLGNQLKSYGGNLSFSIEPKAYGPYIPDEDIIVRGNGLTLAWTRPNEDSIYQTEARFIESYWQRTVLGIPRVATRADLLTVLTNLEVILVRATVYENTTITYLGNVTLDTAVQQNTGGTLVTDIEVCRCPEGYTGISCEVWN